MDCREAQEEILEMFDGTPSAEVQGHLAGCEDCAAFAARQSALDRKLAIAYEPPALSPDFRASLKRRIRKESPKLWPQALPDIVHVVSCLVTTVLCAILLPFGAGPVLGIGALVTAATYVLILAARLWLEA